jgi:NAD(P)-dependent dehydrogenase (short-subunit alcohol dehydrogenase family)
MRDLQGKVAVVTGAGSGIGRAVAIAAGQRGMKLVVADIEPDALATTVTDLQERGFDAIGVATDVSREADIEALAAMALEHFGAVHLLHNNAGVVSSGPIDLLDQATWKWVLGVDMWSVLFGIRTFLPIMKAQGDGHIVSTASVAGLQAAPNIGPYNVAKFGGVALPETLAAELRAEKSPIGVSVLCPGAVNTQIVHAERNRPADVTASFRDSDEARAFRERAGAMLAQVGMDPADVATMVLDAVVDDRFWIITHPRWIEVMEARVTAMREGRLVQGQGG